MIIGLETEYLIYLASMETIGPLSLRGLETLLLSSHLLVDGLMNDDDHRLWLGNGAMMYVDEDLLEYCTPESPSPAHAVAAALAGDTHLARLGNGYEFLTGAKLHVKTNAGPDGRLAGFHENYAVSPLLYNRLFWPTGWPRREVLRVLVPHLVSREAVSACTELARRNGTKEELPLSLKSHLVTEVIGDITEDSRPILRPRTPDFDETLIRLELVCGWRWDDRLALRSLLSSTSLVFYGIESGWFEEQLWELADPADAFRSACQHPEAPLQLASGRRLKPHDLQREIWQQVATSGGTRTYTSGFDWQQETAMWEYALLQSNEWLVDAYGNGTGSA